MECVLCISASLFDDVTRICVIPVKVRKKKGLKIYLMLKLEREDNKSS